ncbi:hypothetical protein AJ80_02108 [Polytolypa hystricis UAMH7299]|uniref:Sucrose transporter n=1 Tax=Polytolypa hystricis (strain UAMH7299) TaxID=1447883 RepID=A0A2B7YRQ5_POLH7|nr:hypothetical protein AJ80_02108 [Polytolypa hystricis UAMH7299]
MQPLVGVIADRSTSKYGRRRPFMVIGSFVVGLCLLVMGWASEIVAVFVPAGETRKNVTIVVAVLSIYAVDFAINRIVQACCRSLIVDTLPIPQQQLGSAWASRMAAIGHLIGYAIGSVDMVGIFGTAMGDSQFKQMTVIAALALIFSVLVTSYAVNERVLVSVRDADRKIGVRRILSQLFRTTVNLPPRIRAICWAQFWAWIGWFPFLFYSTTWVGETYFRYEAPKSTAEKSDTLGEVGRLGSLSLVVFSTITFISSVLLPFGVLSPESKRSTYTPRPPLGIIRLLNKISFVRPDLQTAWMISHLMFAATMIFAPFSRSLGFTTFLVALCGIPWAVSCWAPFAFMGVEINRLAIQSSSKSSSVTMITSSRASNRHSAYLPLDIPDTNDSDLELEERGPSILRLNHNLSDDTDSDTESNLGDTSASSTGELAGIYLGVLNVYTTLPQFVGTFISWIVFSILEPARVQPGEAADDGGSGEQKDDEWMNLNTDGPNAIAVCLFIGALSALVAAEATRRLKYVR